MSGNKRANKYRWYSLLVCLLCTLWCSAKTYKLEGMIGGKYPIVIELEQHSDGLFSGRYAYQSTLRKNGNLACSWLDINPAYHNPATTWTIRDCKLKNVEVWSNVRFSDGKHLSARMKNVQGKVYNVTATVKSSTQNSPSMISHFREHLGDYASEFSMFFDPSIQDIFEDMMGENNFNYMASIYQTETPIEYTNGMYWASGFKAHQCCDPAVLWAYDAYTDKFYVWIRKNGRDYWWSGSGSVPFKFRELVSEHF